MEATDVHGAGEVLVTSMDQDGTGEGYDLELLRAITSAVHVPVVASGGAGDLEHFSEALDEGGADAVLAASRLHYGQLTIRQIKAHLASRRLPVRLLMDAVALDDLAFDDRGLIPAVVQDAENGDVLMMAWMNRESVALTIEEGRTVFWSRSRQELWRKGETSGHVQHVEELRVDCDADVLLVRVHQVGAACHTGERTCFFRTLEA